MVLAKIDSDFLRYLIANGGEPGTRLPALTEISSTTGLSVGKLREQLEVARTLGLIDVSPRRGIMTLPYDFLPAVRLSLMIALALDPESFLAFSSVRIHLETAYWAEAVELLKEEDKDHLIELVQQASAKLGQERIQIPYPEHRDFHLTIFKRLNNPFVQGLLQSYWEAYEAVEFNTYADLSYLRAVWEYHERIAVAIKAGNSINGKELLVEHMHLIDKMGVAHELHMNVRHSQGVSK